MRLRGLGLGRVGMEKLKNSHKGGMLCEFGTTLAQHKVLCEFFAQGTIHPPFANLKLVQMVKIFGF